MDPSPASKIREAIYVPPRPNPGPVSIEVPVSNAMNVAVGVVLSICVLLLLATRTRRIRRPDLASEPVSERTPDRRIADAARRVRDAASEIDRDRLALSRTAEELAADPEVLRILGDETGGRALEFLAACDRARYSSTPAEEDVVRLEAWSEELAGELRRRETAGARSRIKGK